MIAFPSRFIRRTSMPRTREAFGRTICDGRGFAASIQISFYSAISLGKRRLGAIYSAG